MHLPEALRRRLPKLPRLFQAASPSVAVEITDEHVALARVARSGGEPHVISYFVAPLPAGAVRTSPLQPNIVQPAAVAALLKAGRDRVSPGGGPIALCLPDSVVRVALVPIDALPSRAEELREMVAWRMKKTLPFRIEEAAIATHVFVGRAGTPVILAGAVRRKVLAEYESVLESCGFQPGTVTIGTLALAEHLPDDLVGDALLLNVGVGWFSILVTSGPEPVFFRGKALPDAERAGASRDWFVAGELGPTLEYYRTRLKGEGLKRLFLHASGPATDGLREALATAVELPIEPIGIPREAGIPEAAWERLGHAATLAARGAGVEPRVAAVAAAGAGAST